MSTYSAKPSEIVKKWILIDAEGLVVGRLASIIANRLRGKHKPTFTPHMDCGDNIVVINADKVALTGNKLQRQDLLLAHRLSPAASRSAPRARSSKAVPRARARERPCERMLPGGPLGRQQMTNLRVYAGADHPHEAQSPSQARRRSDEPQERSGAPNHGQNHQLSRRPGRCHGHGGCRKCDGSGLTSRSSTPRAAPMRPASARTPSPASGSSRAPARSPSTARTFAAYFARPVLQMIVQPADRRGQPRRPVRRRSPPLSAAVSPARPAPCVTASPRP